MAGGEEQEEEEEELRQSLMLRPRAYIVTETDVSNQKGGFCWNPSYGLWVAPVVLTPPTSFFHLQDRLPL